MDHHDFSPSRLEQFRICPGAYKMRMGLEEHESEFAKEGTKLHAAVAAVANGGDISTQGLDDEQSIQVSACIDFLTSITREG